MLVIIKEFHCYLENNYYFKCLVRKTSNFMVLNNLRNNVKNFYFAPTQKFDKIWFWTNDFSASLLWVIAMTHMHRLLWIYIFCDVICHNNESEKFQLFWLIFMSHNICPKMSLFKFDLSHTVWVTKYESAKLKFFRLINMTYCITKNINSK